MPRTLRASDDGDGPGEARAASPPPSDDGISALGAGESSPGPTEVVPSNEQWAEHLRRTMPSLFLHTAMIKPFKDVAPGAYKIYRERLLDDCGNPSDPIEEMVIDQLALAHFNTALLMCRAANASGVDASGVLYTAAARLMAEFRRSALALQAYRHASRQMARDPARDIASIEGSGLAGDPSAEKGAGGGLIANTEASDGGERIIPYPRSEAV